MASPGERLRAAVPASGGAAVGVVEADAVRPRAGAYARAAIAQAIGRGSLVIASAVTAVAIARVLGAGALGHYAFAVSYLGIAAGIADLGTTPVLAQAMAVRRGAERSHLLATFALARAALAAPVTLAALAGTLLAPQPVRVPLALAVLTLPLLAARFFDPLFQIAARPALSARAAAGYTAFLVPATLAAITTAADPVAWAVGAYAVAGVGYALWCGRATWRLFHPTRTRDLRGALALIRAAAPVGVANLFALASSRMAVFVLTALRGAADVGYYNAASRFFELGVAVAVTAAAPLLPVFAQLGGTRREELADLYGRLLAVMVAAVLPVLALAPLLAPPLVALVYGAQYAPAAGPLAVFAWSFALVCVNLLTSNALLAIGETQWAAWNTLAALVTNLVLSLLLVPRFGITGAALSGLAAEALMTAVCLTFTARRLGPLPLAGLAVPLGAGLALAAAVAVVPAGMPRVGVTAAGIAGYALALRRWGGAAGLALREISALRGRAPTTTPATTPATIPERHDAGRA